MVGETVRCIIDEMEDKGKKEVVGQVLRQEERVETPGAGSSGVSMKDVIQGSKGMEGVEVVDKWDKIQDQGGRRILHRDIREDIREGKMPLGGQQNRDGLGWDEEGRWVRSSGGEGDSKTDNIIKRWSKQEKQELLRKLLQEEQGEIIMEEEQEKGDEDVEMECMGDGNGQQEETGEEVVRVLMGEYGVEDGVPEVPALTPKERGD